MFFYDEGYKDKLKEFCEERNITYLPSIEGSNVCYTLINNDFKEIKIKDEQKVDVDDHIFDYLFLEKFEKHSVLFVFNKKRLISIVHFSDYNRESVHIYLYKMILDFENSLRNLLVLDDLKNEDMIVFFKKHANDEYYSKRLECHNKKSEIEKRKQLEPFQTFYLKDLIGLINHKNILKLSEEACDVRNQVVHFVSPVRHENYEEKKLIYTFDSFKEFFDNVKLLKEQYKKATNKLNLEATI
jgi:hypothetical protein